MTPGRPRGGTPALRAARLRIAVLGSAPFGHEVLAAAGDDFADNVDIVPIDVVRGLPEPDLVRSFDGLLLSGPIIAANYATTVVAQMASASVPADERALHRALLAATAQGLDPGRVSIDSVPAELVEQAYREVGLDPSRLEVIAGNSPMEFVQGHTKVHDVGLSQGAVTSTPLAKELLESREIPVVLMRPSRATLRQSLQEVILRASDQRLGETQQVVLGPRLLRPYLRGPGHDDDVNTQRLIHAAERSLQGDARAVHGVVVPVDGDLPMIVTTMRPLLDLTAGLTTRPDLVRRLTDELDADLVLGIGLATTASAALNAAALAQDDAERRGAGTTMVRGPRGVMIELGKAAVPASNEVRLHAELWQLIDGDGVVDAADVAQHTGVTVRTARRQLQSLVDAGLAWQLPTKPGSRAGRPPQRFQLLPESR
ncbi:helix-turn-helix domain-containing protein [Parenemella sanctibonifatiensis]|uniref:hypothetical protein n=1 Tax=Parenemella sanctibonifatiensis TaxID=2016505 RepID=UPI001185393D|nr:hypothetical protein [Parenemella sanctibonifatiensis]